MDPHAFDRLTRAFSQSASRRRALGGLLGGALAAVGSTSEAKRRQHRHGTANAAATVSASACAKFCTTVFPPGPQRGQCLSDAAKDTSLCTRCQADPANFCNGTCCQPPDTCGGGGTSGVCGCTPNCTGKCGGISDGCRGTCDACPDGQTCLTGNNTCVIECANPNDLPGVCGTCLTCGNTAVVSDGGFLGYCSNLVQGPGSCDKFNLASCPPGQFCDNRGTCIDACLP